MSCVPLGDQPLDSAQTTRKAWCDTKDGHRVVEVNIDFNIIEHTYNDNGQICTISYFHECAAESTKIVFTADCCSSLDDKSFSVFSANDAVEHRVKYSVNCVATVCASTTTVNNILVNLCVNDPAEVVALATKLALEADTEAMADLCITAPNRSTLTITNKIKGLATDFKNGGVCFTTCIIQQGTKTLVEKLTYTYKSCGLLCTVTNISGSNVLDIIGPFNPSVRIESGGNVADVNFNKELRVELSPLQHATHIDILTELKIMNIHLAKITSEEIKKSDIEQC